MKLNRSGLALSVLALAALAVTQAKAASVFESLAPPIYQWESVFISPTVAISSGIPVVAPGYTIAQNTSGSSIVPQMAKSLSSTKDNANTAYLNFKVQDPSPTSAIIPAILQSGNSISFYSSETGLNMVVKILSTLPWSSWSKSPLPGDLRNYGPLLNVSVSTVSSAASPAVTAVPLPPVAWLGSAMLGIMGALSVLRRRALSKSSLR